MLLWAFGSCCLTFSQGIQAQALFKLTKSSRSNVAFFNRIVRPAKSASTSAACPSPARPQRSRTAASSVSRRWPCSLSTSTRRTSTTSSSSTNLVWLCLRDIRSDSRSANHKVTNDDVIMTSLIRHFLCLNEQQLLRSTNFNCHFKDQYLLLIPYPPCEVLFSNLANLQKLSFW